MVCFDEKSVQLLMHIAKMLSVKPGRPARQDDEYEREGTRNLFLFVEPKAGFRHVLVTNRRTKQDFAFAMRYLVDVLYPEAEYIDVVLDNLNTHHYHSLVKFFGKQEADRIMNRLRFHFTPAHASWLHMIWASPPWRRRERGLFVSVKKKLIIELDGGGSRIEQHG